MADASAFLTVPTALERRGDFSQTREQFTNPATGRIETAPINIFNPLAGFAQATEIRPGVFQINRPQFSDGGVSNRIPRQFINPTGLFLAGVYPLPNITPLQPNGTQNFFDDNQDRTRTDQIIFKLDHNWSERQRSFFRWTTDWTRDTPADRFRKGNPQATQQAPTTQFIPTLTIGHTWTKSPASLFEFRFNAAGDEPSGFIRRDQGHAADDPADSDQQRQQHRAFDPQRCARGVHPDGRQSAQRTGAEPVLRCDPDGQRGLERSADLASEPGARVSGFGQRRVISKPHRQFELSRAASIGDAALFRMV
ncbi:MAG: hypothetical protein ACREEM_44140 [Blastocatellia bacterium]